MNNVINYEDKEYASMCNKYMDYIAEHIANVEKSYYLLFEDGNKLTLDGYTDEQIAEVLSVLKEDIKNHDSSKFSDEEFYAYRAFFNPTDKEKELMNDENYYKQAEDAFGDAWKHHYTHNPHHPLFWKWVDVKEYANGVPKIIVVREFEKEPEDMTLVEILHMICDWNAMSIKFNSKVINWYLSDEGQKEKGIMSKNTVILLEQCLSILYNYKFINDENDR